MTDEEEEVQDDDGEEAKRPEEPRGGPDVDEMDQDVFRNVYGHNGAKAFMAAALRSGDTHVLLEGPPGSGKSVFLLALESNVPGCLYRDGDQITPSRLREALKQDPAILLIDEIDALDNEAYDVLSNPMEHGRLVRDSAREQYDVDVGTQVIAACNHAEEIPEHIRNRFRIQEFEKYSTEEFFQLCEKMLVNEVEWVEDEQEAREAAEKIYDVTGAADPRTTRDVAQMANSLEEIDTLAKAMHDPDADVEAGPLYPDEIARAKDEVGKMQVRNTLTQELVKEATQDDEPEGDPEEEAVDEEAAAAIEEDVEQAAEEAAEDAVAQG